jgi:hypothetical protein
MKHSQSETDEKGKGFGQGRLPAKTIHDEQPEVEDRAQQHNRRQGKVPEGEKTMTRPGLSRLELSQNVSRRRGSVKKSLNPNSMRKGMRDDAGEYRGGRQC